MIKTFRAFVVLEHKLHASLLSTADVVCSTALGSGYSKALIVCFAGSRAHAPPKLTLYISQQVDFPIVLLDEAAMCTEVSRRVPPSSPPLTC